MSIDKEKKKLSLMQMSKYKIDKKKTNTIKQRQKITNYVYMNWNIDTIILFFI